MPKITYTPEIAAEICERLAKGETLRSICRDDHMPDESSVRQWVLDDRHGFAPQYTLARDKGLDAIAEEIFDIVDDGQNDYMTKLRDDGSEYEVPNHEHINRSRLRFQARQWYLSKLAPKKYADRLDLNHSGEIKGGLSEDERDKRLARLEESVKKRVAKATPGPNDVSDLV